MAITVTLSTLRADLRATLNDPDGSYVSAAQALRFINMGIESAAHMFAISSLAPFAASDTIALVVDQTEYSLDKEIRLIEKVTVASTDGTARLLEVIPFTDVERIQVGPARADAASPSYYYRRDTNIGFVPTPKEVRNVTLYSQKQPDYLAADGDAIAMPPWVRNLIVYEAAVIGAAAKGDANTQMSLSALRDREKQEVEFAIMRYQSQDHERVNTLWDQDFAARRL